MEEIRKERKNHLKDRFPSDENGHLDFSRLTSAKRKKLLEACYLKLSGELKMTTEEIAEQTGYAGQSVRYALSCMKHNKLSDSDRAYMEERFPGREVSENLGVSRNISEQRKELLDACFSKLENETKMTIKEIATKLGYSEGYIKITLSKIRHGEISGPSRNYLEERRQMRVQALKVADMVQAYFYAHRSWNAVTFTDVDEIQRRYVSIQLSELEKALGKAENVCEAKQITSCHQSGIETMNMALNIVNQRIDMRDNLKCDLGIPPKIDFSKVYKPGGKETTDTENLEVNSTLIKKRI